LTVALTLSVLVLLVAVFSKVGNSLINTERARIVSQVSALAAVYGGESEARKIAQAAQEEVDIASYMISEGIVN
jgi:uncharacterized membrane protein